LKDEPNPSATVVVIRDAAVGLELLLLRRSPRSDGRPGPWVFPGGKVEEQDTAHPGDEIEVARRTAVRETTEEAGLALPASNLVTISRWITPEMAPKRFDTWFFLGTAHRDDTVRVDGGEICDHRWLSAHDALDAHVADEMKLAPPTFVTVTWLKRYERADEAMSHLGKAPVLTFRPKIFRDAEGACILYPGDAGYDVGDVNRPGPRHRLWSLPNGYRYERDDD